MNKTTPRVSTQTSGAHCMRSTVAATGVGTGTTGTAGATGSGTGMVNSGLDAYRLDVVRGCNGILVVDAS